MKRVTVGPVIDKEQNKLLFLLGEELKNPLTHILQLSQLGDKDTMIQAHVQRALNTIDSVLLYRRLVSGQLTLELEPVHVGSVITQVADIVAPQMAMLGCLCRLEIQTSLQPAEMDRRLLQRALVSMWQSFISSAKDTTQITCNARRVPAGIRVTICSNEPFSGELSLAGANLASTQPVQSLAGSATDLLTARGMFKLTGVHLTRSRQKDTYGIGFTLPISKQLQLV